MAVICSQCNEEINIKSDLIVTSGFFQYNAYHEQCYKYKKNLRKFSFYRQINGRSGTWTIAVFIVLFIINLLLESFRSEPVIIGIWAAFVLSTLLSRLISYIKFERKIKKSAV